MCVLVQGQLKVIAVVLVAWVTAEAFLRSGYAVADDKATEQSLIIEGIELRRGGRDADALPKFEKAWRLSQSPRASAQYGLCLQAVGRWTDAEARLLEAINAKGDQWVQKNRDTLRESLETAKANIARVEVYGSPEGATVSVNGLMTGTLPLQGPVSVNAGTVDIEVTKAGYRRGYRALQISGMQYQRVLFRLDADASPEATVKQSPGSVATSVPALSSSPIQPRDVDLSTQVTPEEVTPEETQNSTRPFYKSPWTWVCAGSLVVLGIVAVGLMTGSDDSLPKPDDKGIYVP